VQSETGKEGNQTLRWGELKTIAFAGLVEIQDSLVFEAMNEAEMRIVMMLGAWSGRAAVPAAAPVPGQPIIDREVQDAERVTLGELHAVAERFADRLKPLDVDWLHERPKPAPEFSNRVATLEDARRFLSFDLTYDSDNDGTPDREERRRSGDLRHGTPRGEREMNSAKEFEELQDEADRSLWTPPLGRDEKEEPEEQGSGLPTEWLKKNGLSGADADEDADPDYDGVPNSVEFEHDLDPNNPHSSPEPGIDDSVIIYGRKPSSPHLNSRRILNVQSSKESGGTRVTWTRDEEDFDESPLEIREENADGTWKRWGTAPASSTSMFIPDAVPLQQAEKELQVGGVAAPR
jgi:hypothetical protein